MRKHHLILYAVATAVATSPPSGTLVWPLRATHPNCRLLIVWECRLALRGHLHTCAARRAPFAAYYSSSISWMARFGRLDDGPFCR